MRGVSDDREDVLHEVDEVGLEELGPDLVRCKLLQQEEQDVESNLSHVPHGVLEGPHNGVHQQLELCRGNLQQCCGRERE